LALTLRKLRVVDYVPPLGGRGGGMPIKEVVELEDRVRIILANGRTWELREVELASETAP
jgi:hypothetical protein